MYKIIILKKAKKFIDALPKNERIRVVTAIEQLPQRRQRDEALRKSVPHDPGAEPVSCQKEVG